METLSKLHTAPKPPWYFSPALHSKSPLLFFTPFPSKTLSNPDLKLKAASSHYHHHHLPPTPHQISSHSPNPPLIHQSLSSLLKTMSLSVVFAAALFLTRFPAKISFAAPHPTPSPTPTANSEDPHSLLDDERSVEDHLKSHPHDASALKALVVTKLKLRKIPEAIDAVDRLILLQPSEPEWPLLRAHVHLYGGDAGTARSAFEDLIAADPFCVEAYHGLGMAIGQFETEELDALVKRIEGVIQMCEKQREKREDVRDFRLLIAQLRAFRGEFKEALKLYEQLVREEPRDFRPYLCQGMVYTFLGRKEDAEKQFVKYRRLVPKGHPYGQFFDRYVLGTKDFSEMAVKEKVHFKT